MNRKKNPKANSLRANRGGTRKSSQRGGMERSPNPPMFSSNIRVSHKYRFEATGAVTSSITDSQVLASLGGICALNTNNVTSWATSFRIKKISIWAAPPSQGAASTCSVEWFGFGNSPAIEHSDTTLSVARNAVVHSQPPPQSLCSFWQKATGTALFKLTCPTNSVVDLTVDYILSDDEVTQSTATATVNVLGMVYYLPLDGIATHLLIPVSLVSTF
jgi:hypothetical protein